MPVPNLEGTNKPSTIAPNSAISFSDQQKSVKYKLCLSCPGVYLPIIFLLSKVIEGHLKTSFCHFSGNRLLQLSGNRQLPQPVAIFPHLTCKHGMAIGCDDLHLKNALPSVEVNMFAVQQPELTSKPWIGTDVFSNEHSSDDLCQREILYGPISLTMRALVCR